MRGVLLSLLSLLCVNTGYNVFAQCPSTNFTFASTACLNQTLQASNTSVPGTYQWDFCTGDLNYNPTAQLLLNLPGVTVRPSIEFALDGTKWFGFVTGTFGNFDLQAGVCKWNSGTTYLYRKPGRPRWQN